jgi:hypothetical protein
MPSAAAISDVHRDDAWNRRHRSEAPLQRADRNFAELLQEIRVLLTGVQILLGFLLTMALSPFFQALDTFQHVVYVATLLCGTSSSTLLVAPIATHRLLFQCGRKREVVRAGHVMTALALVGLAGTLTCGLLLVLDLALGRATAVVCTVVLVVGIGVLWIGVPLWLRRGCRAALSGAEATGGGRA